MKTHVASPMAIPGTHEKAVARFKRESGSLRDKKALDLGCGNGYLSYLLETENADVFAIDLGNRKSFDDIEYHQCDVTQDSLPYDNNFFDVIFAVEVLEHFDSHTFVMNNIYQKLKSGGVLVATTPNVCSLKSRLRFLIQGTMYSFPNLAANDYDPARQHTMPVPANIYQWKLHQIGFKEITMSTDKYQLSSLLILLLMPFTLLSYCHSKHRNLTEFFNILLGRKLIITEKK